jgi:hypothetical protein
MISSRGKNKELRITPTRYLGDSINQLGDSSLECRESINFFILVVILLKAHILAAT